MSIRRINVDNKQVINRIKCLQDILQWNTVLGESQGNIKFRHWRVEDNDISLLKAHNEEFIPREPDHGA